MSDNNSESTRLKTILMISILINIIVISGLITVYSQTTYLKNQLYDITAKSENLNSELIKLKQLYNDSQVQLDYYKKQADYYSQLSKTGNIGESITGYAKISIVAVKQAPTHLFSSGYEGVILTAEIELREGEGRSLINTQPKIGIDMQTSLRTAVTVAENVTGISLQSTDVVLTITGEKSVEIVDGPSAGAAVTCAVIAAITNTPLLPNVYITGTINPDGTIGRVGGILEKANASANQGAALFLIPKGQRELVEYRPKTFEPIPGFTITTYEAYRVDLIEYLKKYDFQMTVLEVSTIEEIYSLIGAPPIRSFTD